MECAIEISPSQLNVQLDDQDKAALQEINSLYEQAGLLAALLAASHVISWMDMEVGLTTVAIEDWRGLGQTILNSPKIMLIKVNNIAARQYQRHSLRGTPDQERFWQTYQGVVARAMKGIC